MICNQPRNRRVPQEFAGLSNDPGRDTRLRNQVDNIGTPRCPLCGYPLVVRQGRPGAYFFCLCLVPANKAA